MIDFHNHILPDVDDGSKSIEMTLDMFRTAELQGITDVVNTVHARNEGKYPIIDEKYIPLLNKGLIKNPPFTNFNLFSKSGSRFFPILNEAKYVSSSF